MAEQLYTAKRIYKLINIQNFIYLLSEDIVDFTKDLIKYIAELYAKPDRDAEIDEENFQ